MVENLCLHFGDDTGVSIEGEKKEAFFIFPPVSRLGATLQDHMAQMGENSLYSSFPLFDTDWLTLRSKRN